MTIRIWTSYSCNNSSSYRLVAKFSDAETAAGVAAELQKFLVAHATEVDERGDYSEEPSQAQRELGTKYGFTWSESLHWGDDALVGDEPEVFLENDVMIVLHTYCGGLGELKPLLTARGADVTAEDSRGVSVSVLFRSPAGANPQLDAELAEMYAQLEDDEPRVSPLRAPWTLGHESYGTVAWFRDAGVAGFCVPLDPRDIAALKAWLSERGLDHASVRIEEAEDLRLFGAIAKARCTACSGALEYLDPRLHDIETPQLVCKPCGGLYELQAFVTP
jgi:hypothetical protein